MRQLLAALGAAALLTVAAPAHAGTPFAILFSL